MHLRRSPVTLQVLFGAILGFAIATAADSSSALVSTPGQVAPVPAWYLQSSTKAASDLEALSRPGIDTSGWLHVNTSKCTLMGCLLEAGIYNDTELFYSDNLRRVDSKQFEVPWLFRQEFGLDPGAGKYFHLLTHGITSRADVYLNGKQVADKKTQAGSYGGHTYDITDLVDKDNALLIQAYPTSYYADLAVGWGDWNPWPADNGTGVWRDVEVKQTGSVALGPLRVVTQLGTPLDGSPANVTLKSRAQNLENIDVTITVTGTVSPEGYADQSIIWSQTVTLPPLSTTDVTLTTTVQKPAIWWPKQWGSQPLYNAQLSVFASNNTLSDQVSAVFGFRTVTSQLNSFNDITFLINSHPFQVLGAGYAPDMFLRFSPAKFESEARYVLDLGFNTIRLEGKNEHPELYQIADRLGIMILAGWECCDKWEAWSYNQDLTVPTPVWSEDDYNIANASMFHEAGMLQTHPSILGYLIGSDYWPDSKAAPMYINTLRLQDWQTPVLSSASKRGFPSFMGSPGLKMEGPYDWVPPNYWYDTEPSAGRFGAAFGFGSELGAGVGTPDSSSLHKFLSPSDLTDLWKNPNKDLFHMSSTETSSFRNRRIYNTGLWNRWSAPTSLEDYVQKSQITDYEATRAQFEGYAANWGNSQRPATGMIYWMLNGAFPSLHWSIWDYYMHPAGAYFGAKVGSRIEHVAFDYVKKSVVLINRSLDKEGPRSVDIEIIDPTGKTLYTKTVKTTTEPNTSREITSLASAFEDIKDVVFLRLVLSGTSPKDSDTSPKNSNPSSDVLSNPSSSSSKNTELKALSNPSSKASNPSSDVLSNPSSSSNANPSSSSSSNPSSSARNTEHKVLSSNTYWLSSTLDTLSWDNSNWYYTPVSEYSDYTALNKLPAANVSVSVTALSKGHSEYESSKVQVTLENHSSFPAFFISLNLVNKEGQDVVPVIWDDNYLTLWPREKATVQVGTLEGAELVHAAAAVKVAGKNLKGMTVMVG
ncbi:exo-beta-D-glucosaminidase, variant [Neurospora crassa OR74A]|uniref:Exo-beta-D-glucosaminidase, variant n=1 Tax=Neurospora crassa (strain ATCC 24698 / 74-OR23-1A / CBS 708.71 / DSM 1257 / FGSC 987) TaxID=367110 RepID=V5IL91_NEUCR|nr:exo-beta-D-glucosaminidase, variant [Neurospora crassa OR74A]ESA41814.1 exo-beta-D-glucosaminidase, variant [Neurospora crassa OR74A]|eukprot:XP_011395282.1 exo-beta-D-glucosaminidase, variant [Neurospora crassa OR74A]